MTVKDALCRGANFLAVSGLAILATSTAHEFAVAGLTTTGDDVAVAALAVIAVVWYNVGRNKYDMTLAPFGYILAAAIAKLVGLYLAEGTLLVWTLDTAVALFLLLFGVAFLSQYRLLVDRQRRRRKKIHGYWN